jgi:hypothetical protein
MAGPLKKSTPMVQNLNLNLKGTPVKGVFKQKGLNQTKFGQAIL